MLQLLQNFIKNVAITDWHNSYLYTVFSQSNVQYFNISNFYNDFNVKLGGRGVLSTNNFLSCGPEIYREYVI